MWPFGRAVDSAGLVAERQRRREARDLHDADPAGQPLRWTPMLVVFLRCLALLWMLRGLMNWSSILGLDGAEPGFEEASTVVAAVIVTFAVLDCVAAVGLWLTSAWGGVLWLAVALGEVALPVLLPGHFSARPGPNTATGLLMFVYFLLTWLSTRERGRDG